jgi:integrase
MSCKKNAKGQFELEFQQGGRRIHRVLPRGTTKVQAKAIETKIRQEITLATELGKIPDYSLGEAILRYLDEEMKGRKSEKHTREHAKALKDYVVGQKLKQIAEVAEAYKNAHRGKLSNATINRRLAVLRRTANLAYKRWEWLREPLGMKIEALQESGSKGRFYSRSDIAGILWAVRKRKRNHRVINRVILGSLYTGLRRGELTNLKPGDFADGLIRLGDQKSGKVTNTPVVPWAHWIFRRLPFATGKTALSKAVGEVIDGRFHDLRHSFGSWLLNNGEPIEVVSKLLRHSSVAITSRIYSHILLGTQRQTVERGLRKIRKAPTPKVHAGESGDERKIA